MVLNVQATVAGFHWMPFEACGRETSLLSVQARVLELVRRDVSSPANARGIKNLEWLAHVRAWVDSSLAETGDRTIGEPHQYRATPAIAVVRLKTSCSEVFIRTAPRDDPSALLLAQFLHDRLPETFPKVLALDTERGWLLTDRIAGQPLSSRQERSRLPLIVAAMGRAGRALGAFEPRLRDLAVPSLDLSVLVTDLERLLFSALRERAVSQPEIDETRAALEHVCGRWERISMPRCWCHGDPAPQNIFIDGDAVGFIDVESSVIAAPAVGFQLFWRGLADVQMQQTDVRQELTHAFIEQWQEYADIAGLHASLQLSPFICDSMRVWLDLKATPALVRQGEIRCPVERLLARGARTLIRRLRTAEAELPGEIRHRVAGRGAVTVT